MSYSNPNILEVLFNAYKHTKETGETSVVNTCKGVITFKRSSTILPSYVKVSIEENNVETIPITQTKCLICGETQFELLSGITCINGHGGAESK